jgi:hypothetical protein
MNAELKSGSGFKVHIILSLALLVAAIVVGGTYPGSGAPTAAAAVPGKPKMPVCGEVSLQSRGTSGSGRSNEMNGQAKQTAGLKADAQAGNTQRESAAEACSGN